jgi:hypothetical protein
MFELEQLVVDKLELIRIVVDRFELEQQLAQLDVERQRVERRRHQQQLDDFDKSIEHLFRQLWLVQLVLGQRLSLDLVELDVELVVEWQLVL